MNMRDIIHLVFYELTITTGQRYHSITRDIIPFLWQNWDKLVLSVEVKVEKFKFKKN